MVRVVIGIRMDLLVARRFGRLGGELSALGIGGRRMVGVRVRLGDRDRRGERDEGEHGHDDSEFRGEALHVEPPDSSRPSTRDAMTRASAWASVPNAALAFFASPAIAVRPPSTVVAVAVRTRAMSSASFFVPSAR